MTFETWSDTRPRIEGIAAAIIGRKGKAPPLTFFSKSFLTFSAERALSIRLNRSLFFIKIRLCAGFSCARRLVRPICLTSFFRSLKKPFLQRFTISTRWLSGSLQNPSNQTTFGLFTVFSFFFFLVPGIIPHFRNDSGSSSSRLNRLEHTSLICRGARLI